MRAVSCTIHGALSKLTAYERVEVEQPARVESSESNQPQRAPRGRHGSTGVAAAKRKVYSIVIGILYSTSSMSSTIYDPGVMSRWGSRMTPLTSKTKTL